MLFHTRPTDTQLDYKLRHLPLHMLGTAAISKVRNSTNPVAIRKRDVVHNLDKDATHLLLHKTAWKITWLYNNIPSADEWGRKSATFLVTFQLRSFWNTAGQIENVAIFSFASPDEVKRARELNQFMAEN